jgi:TatD DNase family protein
MNLRYIDIHSHLNLEPLSENQEVILQRMREGGVGTITVGTGLETSKMAIEIAEKNSNLCWATVGFHPCDGHVPDSESDWDEMKQLASHAQVVAIGETGLDYFRDQSPETKEKQVEIFKKHIALAVSVNKPLMLHVRSSKGSDDAYYDALEILSQYKNIRADFHFFSGSKQCMLDIIAAGFTISVDGPITFVAEYDDMIRACPIDKVMIETDAPFAAPAPYRGKTCEPWMVVEIARKVAELKGLDLETVRIQMLENTQRFFGIQA